MLLLIFFTQVGYYGLFAVEQELIRHEQKRKLLSALSNDELERIPFHPSMIFMDDDQEFSLDGEQYDIVRTSEENGVRIFYAVNDKNETRLLRKLADAARNHQQQQSGKKGLLKIIQLYCADTSIESSPLIQLSGCLIPVLPKHRGTLFNKDQAHPPDPAQV